MTTSFWQRWLNRRSLRRGGPTRAQRPRSCRLAVEALEERLTPATHQWVGGSGDVGNTWSNPTNWQFLDVPGLVGEQDIIVHFSGGIISFLDYNVSISQLEFSGSGNSVRSSNGAVLTFADASLDAKILDESGGNGIDPSLPLVIDDPFFRVQVNAGELKLASNVSGAGSVRKLGGGQLTLQGNNSYTGSTFALAGTLVLDSQATNHAVPGFLQIGLAGQVNTAEVRLQKQDQISESTGIDVYAGAKLNLAGHQEFVGALSIIDGTVTTGSGLLILNGFLTMTGGTVDIGTTGTVYLGGRVMATSSETQTATIGGAGVLELSGQPRTIITNPGAQTTDLQILAVISGNAGVGLIKSGSGSLFLGADNTYTGSTTVNEGILTLSSPSGNTSVRGELDIGDDSGDPGSAVVRIATGIEAIADSAKVVVKSDGLYDLNNQNEAVGPLFIIDGTVTTGAATLTLNGALSMTGGKLDTGTSGMVALIKNFTATDTATQSPQITGAGTLTLSGSRTFNVVGASTLLVTAALADGANVGGLVKIGAGGLTLFGSNSYSGNTAVKEGLLELDNGSALGLANGTAAAGTTVAPGAVLTLRGVAVGNEALTLDNPQYFGVGASGSGPSSWAGPITLASDSVVSTFDSLTLSGAIHGAPRTLTKTDGSTLKLTANNDYGSTIVNGGTLLVDGLQAANAITLNAGILGGIGQVGAITAKAGTLDTGDSSTGTLTAGPASFNASATFAVQLNGAAAGSFDQLVAKSVGLGSSILSVTANQVFAAGSSFKIISNTGANPISETFNGLPEGAVFTANSNKFSITYEGGDGNDVVLSPIAAPAITSGSSATFTVGVAGSFTVTAIGTPAPTLSESGPPPGGVTFNAATGVLGGTPTQSGTFHLTFTAHNGVDTDAIQNFTLTVNQVLALGTLSQTQWDVNRPGYTGAIAVANGTAPYSNLSVTGLPPGLTASLSGTAITLSGTPTQAGNFNSVNVSIRDAGGATAAQTYSIGVTIAPFLGGLSWPQWDVNQPGYGDSVIIFAGTSPFSNLSVSGLPTGVTASLSSGIISLTGTPTQIGTFNAVQFSVVDVAGATAAGAYTITITQKPSLGTLSQAQWDVDQAGYSAAIAIADGSTGLFGTAFSNLNVTGLPAGLTAALDGRTITLSGTPLHAGTFSNVQVSMQDVAGATATRTYTITINPAPSLSALAPTQWDVNQAGFSGVIAVADGTAAFSSLSVTGLPSGLTPALNGSTVFLSGTPTQAGTFDNVHVSVQDFAGITATRTYTITINQTPTLGTLSPTQWPINQPGYSGAIAIHNGTAPLSNLVVAGLPSGLTAALNGSTITISGTPLQAGTFSNVQVSVTDAAGATATQTDTITVSDVVLSRVTNFIVTAADAGAVPRVRVFNPASPHAPIFNFLAYAASFKGGVRVATADVNGDGFLDIITAPGPGTAALVRVFGGTVAPGQVPQLLYQFKPYGNAFKGGVYVAAGGDVNGDGLPDIVTGPGAGIAPTVKIYSGAGGGLLGSFNAFAPSFKGGVTVATGDVNGDHSLDIVAGMGAGNQPRVRVFNAATHAQLAGPIGNFLAYTASFKGGVFVAAGDLDGNGSAEIITGPGTGAAPTVKVFTPPTVATPRSISAYPANLRKGVRVATGDLNGDGKPEILIGLGPLGNAEVRIFDGVSLAAIDSFFAEAANFKKGLFLAGSRV